MIKISLCKNQFETYTVFTCFGHVGYDDKGYDIVCASISVLVINTINSIEKFTQTKIIAAADEKSGEIVVSFPNGCDSDASLLVNAMILGLQDIQKDYGKKFLTLDFKEV